jgi:two-component system, NarL family, nitrate/nitrite response regulator NarL
MAEGRSLRFSPSKVVAGRVRSVGIRRGSCRMLRSGLPSATNPGFPIRVVVVAGICFYRNGLVAALTTQDRVHVVGEAATWREALPLVRGRRPDVVLLDVEPSGETDGIHRLSGAWTGARVIALSVREPEADLLPLAEAGISGYVTRDQTLAELVGVTESVVRGELPCSPRIAAGLLHHIGSLARSNGRRPLPGELTRRESEIVELIDCGLSNREIARRLYIEPSTVKNHVHNILEKLQVSGRADAVARVRAGSPAAATSIKSGRR